MASIKPRKNKNGKITSWYYSVSNYPSPAIREDGFKTRKEAEAAAKFVESKLVIKKQKRKLSNLKYSPKPFYFDFEQ